MTVVTEGQIKKGGLYMSDVQRAEAKQKLGKQSSQMVEGRRGRLLEEG